MEAVGSLCSRVLGATALLALAAAAMYGVDGVSVAK